DLGVPALAAVAGNLGHGDPADPVLTQGVGDRLQGVRLDDGGDELHRVSPVVTGAEPASTGVPVGVAGAGLRGSASSGSDGNGTGLGPVGRSRREARAPARSYPASACWVMSIPARSSASVTRQPSVYFRASAITAVST